MAQRVTIQDIADALGISRNTVSKAINNSSGLSDATRDRILQKATELGYKQFSYINQLTQSMIQPDPQPAEAAEVTPKVEMEPQPEQEPVPYREIALLMRGFQDSSHFCHTMLDKFQREITQQGYVMTIHHLSDEEIHDLRLPLTFHPQRTSGVICVELFDEAYARMLGDLKLPLLFADAPVVKSGQPLPTDILLMENCNGVIAFVNEMLRQGKREIGFLGHCYHCISFFERYMAFRTAMVMQDVPINEDFCIIGMPENKRYASHTEHRNYIHEQLSKLEHLPEVFVCANDFVAIDLIAVCRQMGYRVPEDIKVCGFDNAPEASIVTPSLTTVHIHSQIMGLTAAHLLLSRIQEPEMHFRTVHTETKLLFRESAPCSMCDAE